jgi:hypothetical protein
MLGSKPVWFSSAKRGWWLVATHRMDAPPADRHW